MFCFTNFVVIASASFAQIDSNHEQLKAIGWVMGDWNREWTVDKDTSFAKKGDKAGKEWHFAWTANKNALLIGQNIIVHGKTKGRMDALFGWDKQAEKIVGAGFASDGVFGRGWTIQTGENKFTIVVGSSEWVFMKKGNDSLQITNPQGVRLDFRRMMKK